jgi:uncharacterized membrane protein (DUF4010 family)
MVNETVLLDPLFFGLCVALGVGLLVGAERERRKGSTSNRNAAGIRTFAVTSLLGAVGYALGGPLLLGVVALVVGAGMLIAYQRARTDDPGLTTEFALVLTCLLGGLAIDNPALSGGVGAVLTLLLAARERMHRFVSSVLSQRELHDIILFSATALIVWPLAPDEFMGPFSAINPHALVGLVVVVMAISALGYVAVRWLGPRYGLPLAGFASGFISSTATVYAMGGRASRNPALVGSAVAGAALSSLATFVQLAFVILLVQPALLRLVGVPLALGGATAGLFGLFYFYKGTKKDIAEDVMVPGRAFDVKASLAFAAILTSILLLSAGMNASFGSAGLWLGAAVAGLADAHATAASTASLVASGTVAVEQGIVPIFIGLTTNTLSKAVVAFKSGGSAYGMQIMPGLVAMMAAAWFGVWLTL